MTTENETLHTCPSCGTDGFTARGLKAHRCDGKNRKAKTLEVATIPQTLGLASMSEGQLAETFTKLDATREHYDNLSGICATLQGLVLIEVKAKVGHGKYGHWIKQHFPKSYQTANRFVRIAEAFLERTREKNTPEAKSLRSERFAETLLLTDLAGSLEAVRSQSLDLDHPIIQSVAAYASGRSYNQMWLDLGPAPLGGDHRSRDEEGNPLPRTRRTKAEIERDEFETLAAASHLDTRRALLRFFSITGPEDKAGNAPRAWDVLDDKALTELKQLAIDLRDGILETERRRATLRPRAAK